MMTIDLSSPYIQFFFAASAVHTMWGAYLAWRERDYVIRTEGEATTRLQKLHAYAKEVFSREKLQRSLAYERTATAFGQFESRVSQLICLAALAFGLVPWMLQVALLDIGLPVWAAIALTSVALLIGSSIIELPFDYHSAFALEERFGFNTMTLKLFFSDFAKSIAIGSIMQFAFNVGLFFAFYGLFKLYGDFDIWACLTLAVASLLFSMVFEVLNDKLILPLFNEMTPLEDGPLKTRMEDMLKAYGYSPDGVFVIDASKRSKHSNAYCAGWGKNKHLVLFDTMLKSFSDDEILAVLGHELAHAKLNHLVWGRAMSFVETFAFLYAASLFVSGHCISLMSAFGFRGEVLEGVAAQSFTDVTMMKTALMVIAFSIFGKIWNSASWILDGLESWISRKMEFAADAYSCKYTGNSEAMVTALFKLHNENLSYPISDPLYEAWSFSHPSLVNRVEALLSDK